MLQTIDLALVLSLFQGWAIEADGRRTLRNFTGYNITTDQLQQTSDLLIINSNIQVIEDNFAWPKTTNASLLIINTTIHHWRASDMASFARISFISSTIKQLHSDGISITPRDSVNCNLAANETTTIRFINSTVEELHERGIVLTAAGSLLLDGSTVGTLHSDGIRLGFRVQLRATGSVIQHLQPGAFCGVCSDIIDFRDNHVQDIDGSAAQALRFGSPACLEQCRLQRLHLHRIADNRLPCGSLPALGDALRLCRLRQPLPAPVCCRSRACDADGDAARAVCGDLSRLANTSLCLVATGRLLHLPEQAPEPELGLWCAAPAVATGIAVGLAAFFLLLGVVAGCCCCCCCCSQRRRGAHTPHDEPPPLLTVSAPLNTSRYRRQRALNVAERLRRISSRLHRPTAADVPGDRAPQNEYGLVPPQGPGYELPSRAPAPESPLPSPPSWPAGGAARARPTHAPPRSPTHKNPAPIYENLPRK